MSIENSDKFGMPGWRIEQRYSPGVLIGNWGEERYQFQKGKCKHNSTYRLDFNDYGSFKPDVILRRKAQLQNSGLSKELLFYHHGNRYSNNMISWYDEHYNKRERDEKNRLPDLRQWNSHQLAWVPEKTDYPIQGDPTNFGLHSSKQQDWGAQVADATYGDYNTTYRVSYTDLPGCAMTRTRYATPKHSSTSLNNRNAVNKNLELRGKMDLSSPEVLASVENPPAAPALVH